MEKIIIFMISIFSVNSFAAEVDYGFVNQGLDGRSCFVGIDSEDYMYSGSVLPRSLSEEGRRTLSACSEAKLKGEKLVIKIVTTYFKTENPFSGVEVLGTKKSVFCISPIEFEYEDFLNLWRYEIRVSSFKNCPI